MPDAGALAATPEEIEARIARLEKQMAEEIAELRNAARQASSGEEATALEKKIDALEARLSNQIAELKIELGAITAEEGEAESQPQPEGPVTGSGGYRIVTPEEALRVAEKVAAREAELKRKRRGRSSRAAANEPERGAGPEDRKAKTEKAQADQIGMDEEEKNLHALDLYRDTSATLQRNQFEIAEKISYGRSERFLQKDRILTSITSLRYGITQGMELGLIFPAYYSRRRTETGYGEDIIEEVTDLGDTTVQLSTLLWRQTVNYPGATFTGGIILPTSRHSPYLKTGDIKKGGDPRDPMVAYQAEGHWAVKGDLLLHKIYDPIVLFAGVGVQASFAKRIRGYRIRPGLKFTGTFGVSMAMNEFSTIGVQLNAALQEPIRVNGHKARTGWMEQYSMTLVLIQRLFNEFYLEPSVTFGLNDSAEDVRIALGGRVRF